MALQNLTPPTQNRSESNGGAALIQQNASKLTDFAHFGADYFIGRWPTAIFSRHNFLTETHNENIKFAVALVALTATSVFAQPYIGASAGRVDHKQNRADWQPIGGVTAYKDIDTGFKLFGGYQFNQYFGVAGGYNYLGQYTASPTAGASVGKAVVKTDSWNIFGVGTVPLPADFSLFGKLGVSSNYSKIDFSSNASAQRRNRVAHEPAVMRRSCHIRHGFRSRTSKARLRLQLQETDNERQRVQTRVRRSS